MSEKSMMPAKLLTAVLPMECDVLGILDGLRTELGVIATSAHLGRGAGHLPVRRFSRRLGEVSEKKVLTAVVSEDRAEAAFAYIYEKAEMDHPHGGILYQQSLARSTVYELPDLPLEER